MSRIRANTITNQNANGAPNFPDGLTVTGIVTATVSSSTLGSLSVTGNATVGGTLGVGGTLTYEDVTNIDSVGIITARSGINLTGGNITLGDSGGSSDDRIKLGASGDLEIYHSGSHSHITDAGTGGLKIRGSQVIIDDAAGDVMIQADQDGSVDLYHNGTKRIETTAAGVTVTGTVTDSKGNVRSIPLNSQSSAYVLVAADAGKVVYISSGGVTINENVFTAGDAVTIINNSGSNQTLTEGSGSMVLYNTADGTTGSRTLAGRGMCTLYWATASNAYISGAGLS